MSPRGAGGVPDNQEKPMTFDLDSARAETPGCAHVLHLNNAGAALVPQPVMDAVAAYLEIEGRLGGYETAEREHERLEGVYASVARLLGCDADEIALMDSATRAWAMAFYGLGFRPGDRILTSISEYASNYIAYLQVARHTGAKVEPVPNDESGQLDVAALEAMLDERVKLISISHIPTNGGLVQPAAAVGALARRHGIPYLLDACQSAGQLPLDVTALGCDMLSATGRKYLRGPRGTGFLYVRKDFLERLEPPVLDLHSAEWTAPDAYEIRPDARRFEMWESSLALHAGLGAAVEYALGWGLEAIRERVYTLAADFREGLEAVAGVTVRDLGRERCGIVTFTCERMEAPALKTALAGEGINVSTTGRSGTLLDMDARGLGPMVRASVHYYNSEAELKRFVETVGRLAG
jgi:selenocysteine lyase/cysteine desulfurase